VAPDDTIDVARMPSAVGAGDAWSCVWHASGAGKDLAMAHKGDQTLLMWNDFWTSAYQAIDD
jgi:hypothetical protein